MHTFTFSCRQPKWLTRETDAGVLASITIAGPLMFGVPVRRSSTGDSWAQCATRAELKLRSGAYIHWYEAAGCERQIIEDSANVMRETAAAYHAWFR
jgi:hypothetical protein